MKKITTLLIALLFFTHTFSQTTTGIVAYFPFNGTVTDAGPNSISATNFGATATTNNAGVANKAMAFSNTNANTLIVDQYATHAINATTSFVTTQNFTIAFACKITSLPTSGGAGLYDNNLNYGGPGVWAWKSNGFPQIQFNFKNGSVGTTNGAFTLGTWFHVAAVHNGSSLIIYINGVQIISGTQGSTNPTYSFPARIGTMFASSFSPPQYNGLNGSIDELRIYNRALTAAEIALLSSSALPIKLTSFTTTTQSSNVLLKWQTASESNTLHYLVQRSTNGTQFANIGTVNAKGNSAVTTNYTYTDGNATAIPNTKALNYRLQSVDIDGKTQYSPVVSVAITNKTDAVLILQNPVKNNVALQITSTAQQQASITITNSMGQVMSNTNYTLSPGSTSLSIPALQLSKGIYFITVHYNNTKQTIPILKE
jgi:Concanavalin A-like lectin/glucanases superfamily/Secretion system C-terminal sorting domain